MKKVMVVCRAGPRSSKWPRPIPSNWHRNSLRPLESRDTRGITVGLAPGPALAVFFTGEAATAAATRPCEDVTAGPGTFWLLPVRNLSNRLILVRHVCTGFHRQGLDRRGAGRFFMSAGVAGIFAFRDLYFAVNLRSLFDGNSKRGDVAANVASASDLDAIPAA